MLTVQGCIPLEECCTRSSELPAYMPCNKSPLSIISPSGCTTGHRLLVNPPVGQVNSRHMKLRCRIIPLSLPPSHPSSMLRARRPPPSPPPPPPPPLVSHPARATPLRRPCRCHPHRNRQVVASQRPYPSLSTTWPRLTGGWRS